MNPIDEMPSRQSLITIFIVAMLTSTLIPVGFLSIYDTRIHTPSSGAGPRLSITDANIVRDSNGHFFLSFNARNAGTDTVSLRAKLLNQNFLIPQGAFSIPVIPRGGMAEYYAKIENVGEFNGSTGSVRVSNSASLNSPTFSIEVAFQRAGNGPDNQMVLGKGASGENSFYFFSYRSLNVFNDFVVYVNGTRYDHDLGDIFAPNTWYHVVLTLDGSDVSAFVNGNLIQTWKRAVRFEGNNYDLLVGNCVCGGYYFNGSIGFVRFYDRALNARDALWNFENATKPVREGLTMWLSLNATSNGAFPDLSNHGNAGGLAAGVTVISPVSVGETYLVTAVARTSIGIDYSILVSVVARDLSA